MAKKIAVPSAPTAERTPPAHGKNPSFTTVLKAFYGAIKLYRSLLLSITAVAAVVLSVASKWEIPLWIAGVVCGMPAVLILLWLVPTWLEHKNALLMKKLGIHGHIKDFAYFRLTPYESASDFNRADKVHEAVYAWLITNTAPLVYLSGASGSGKSSIISGPGCCRNSLAKAVRRMP